MPSAQGPPRPGGAYELFAFPGSAQATTHPARLEVLARLFGLDPRSAAGCRVLELGCGDAGNLLSMAQALPASSFLGIDASAGAIARGRGLAADAGLTNVELRVGDLDRQPPLDSFDYILAHGVYSWVPPHTRGSLLACCRAHLAPQGVAYVSYNAYPGSYLRDMARDILLYHVGAEPEPRLRLERARELMATIVAIEEPSPFAAVLRDQMARMLQSSEALLVHDELADVSTPFYFHEFMEHAARHGLQFLSEAELSESQMRGVPDSAAHLMGRLPDDVVVREQYLDFFKNRMFRQTLLCHAEIPVRRVIDDETLARLMSGSAARPAPASDDSETFSTPQGEAITTSDPLVRAAMHALANAWPCFLSFPELLGEVAEVTTIPGDVAAGPLRAVLLQAYVARVVLLSSVGPPVVAAAGARPEASPLARAQRARGLVAVSSLLHASVRLDDELDAALLPLLDGTRDRDALRIATGREAEQLDDALERLAWVGLLSA